MTQVLNYRDISDRLQLRAPWRLLDFAAMQDDSHWIGCKNFTMGEAFFVGHFPVHPIVPGVLQIEAIRQLSLCFLPGGPAKYRVRKVEKVKFRRQVLPGDRMQVEAEIVGVDGDDIQVRGKCSTVSGLCSEGLVTFTAAEPPKRFDALPEVGGEAARTADIPMDTDKVMSLMPHRYPFLFIDYIAKIDGSRVIAVKNVSGNEAFIDAGFDVVPEALMCEIAAQSGCACVLARPENKGKLGFFMAIDSAVYHRRVYPGERMLIELDLPEGKSRFGKGSGIIRIGDEVVMEVSLMFALVDA